MVEIGSIEALFRYPVKSMAGERIEAADLGWHGLEGDRRLALRRVDDRSGMPWLTASKLPALVKYVPLPAQNGPQRDLPTHVRTPDGEVLPVAAENSPAGSLTDNNLAADVTRRYGAPVQMMQLRHGIFDEAPVSLIASETVNEIARLAGLNPAGVGRYARRFRPNILVRLLQPGAFQEDNWLGGTLSFGEHPEAPAIAVTMRDERCSMVNLDPDTAGIATEVMKAVVRANQNNAGIYAAVNRTGRIEVGQRIFFREANDKP